MRRNINDNKAGRTRDLFKKVKESTGQFNAKRKEEKRKRKRKEYT